MYAILLNGFCCLPCKSVEFCYGGQVTCRSASLVKAWFQALLGQVQWSTIPMIALSCFSVGYQVCSPRVFYSAWPELQSLSSLVRYSLSSQPIPPPLPVLIFCQAWQSLALLIYSLVFGQRLKGFPIKRLLELFLCIARYSAVPCPKNSSYLGSPELQLVSSIQYVFFSVWALLLCATKSAPRQKNKVDVELTLCFSQQSHPCAVYCPMPKNNCFMYFI